MLSDNSTDSALCTPIDKPFTRDAHEIEVTLNARRKGDMVISLLTFF
jgi:hypothetical protein